MEDQLYLKVLKKISCLDGEKMFYQKERNPLNPVDQDLKIGSSLIPETIQRWKAHLGTQLRKQNTRQTVSVGNGSALVQQNFTILC